VISPNNRDTLTDVIKGLPIGEMSELAGLADTGADDNEDTGAAFVADETEFNIFNTDQKLAALESASRMLSPLPEKKALIYFTGGVSKTGVDNQAQLEASINAAVKANVAIYPIDARGLMADPPGGAASKAASRGTGAYNGSVYQFAAQPAQRFAGNAGDARHRYRRQGVFRQQRSRAMASRKFRKSSAATTSSVTTPPTPPKTAAIARLPSS